VIRRVCAQALVLNSASNVSDMTNERVVLTRLSMVVGVLEHYTVSHCVKAGWPDEIKIFVRSGVVLR